MCQRMGENERAKRCFQFFLVATYGIASKYYAVLFPYTELQVILICILIYY